MPGKPVLVQELDSVSPCESLAGRDLCSVADLTPGELHAILELAHQVKREPAAISLGSRRQADGHVL